MSMKKYCSRFSRDLDLGRYPGRGVDTQSEEYLREEELVGGVLIFLDETPKENVLRQNLLAGIEQGYTLAGGRRCN